METSPDPSRLLYKKQLEEKIPDMDKIRQYALRHKLTLEHDAISPMSLINCPVIPEVDDPSERIPPLANSPCFERLQVNRETADFLTITQPRKTETKTDYGFEEYEEYERMRLLKVDEPVLYFDSEYWKYKARDVKVEVPIRSLGLPKEKEVGGFGLSKEENEEAVKVKDNLSREKLEVNNAALALLKEVAKPVERDVMKEYLEAMEWVPSGIPEKLTPPLSPINTAWDFFLPPVIYDLQPDTSRCAVDDEDIRRQVTDEHLVIPLDTAELLESTKKVVFEPSTTEQNPESSDPLADIPSIFDLKLDVPLMPLSPPPSSKKKKSVRFSDVVFEIPRFFPSSEESSTTGRQDSVEAEFIESVLRPSATKLMQELEQDQLIPADSEQRLSVPIMDFSKPKAPWDDTSDAVVRGLKKQLGRHGSMWDYDRSIDIEKLVWRLSGDIGDMGLADEEITKEEETKFEKTMEELVPRGKEEKRLLILADLDDWKFVTDADIENEEDLEYAPMEPKNDLDSLIRRKKYKQAETKAADLTRPKKRQSLDINEAPRQRLSMFLSIRDQKQLSDLRKAAPSAPSAMPPPKSVGDTPLTNLTPKSVIATPVIADLPHRIFIVSTRLLADSKLYKSIRTLYENATFVERDLSFMEPTLDLTRSPTSPTVNNTEVGDSNDVDIIISPKAGLIVTSIRKVRQKPLPGEVLAESIRDCVVAAAEKYEELIVIVSYTGDGGMSKSDSEELASFTAHVEPATVILVEDAGGGGEVARWVVAVLAEYGFEFEKKMEERIMDERQSVWETYLRRAGFNLFAARVLINMFDYEGGLLGFVAMTHERRNELCGDVVGERMLQRFATIVETGWP